MPWTYLPSWHGFARPEGVIQIAGTGWTRLRSDEEWHRGNFWYRV